MRGQGAWSFCHQSPEVTSQVTKNKTIAPSVLTLLSCHQLMHSFLHLWACLLIHLLTQLFFLLLFSLLLNDLLFTHSLVKPPHPEGLLSSNALSAHPSESWGLQTDSTTPSSPATGTTTCFMAKQWYKTDWPWNTWKGSSHQEGGFNSTGTLQIRT